jgi:lipoprotein signal peptidase
MMRRGQHRDVRGVWRHHLVSHLTLNRGAFTMGKQAAVALYIVLMVAVIVGVDVMFFRGRAWERLMVNIGIVLVFGAFYMRFLNASR